MAEEYLEEVTLPSKGLFYKGEIPDGRITIEPFGTREEKLLATGKTGSVIINKIFENCVHGPVDHLELVLGDRLYLLLKLRCISYGDEYRFPWRCSECGKRNQAAVDLSKLEIQEVADDASNVFEVKLPVLGHELGVRLLTGLDEEKVQDYVKRMTSKATNVDAGALGYIYRLARRVESINDEPTGIRESMELIDSLKGKDSVHLRDEIDDHDVGPIMEIEQTCAHCGWAEDLTVPFDKQFFRPTRRRAGHSDHIRTAEAIDGVKSRELG